MSLPLYVAFLAAAAALMLIPGPNVALIVATSLSRGVGAGLTTVAGTSAAMALQLVVAGLGIAGAHGLMAQAFESLRLAGVAYLLWLGWRAWTAPDEGEGPRPDAAGATFRRGFVVSLANPKTIAFYVAFLPQFVDAHAPIAPQMALLGVSFVTVALLIDGGWALLAGRFGRFVALSGRARGRITGAILIGAALALALARRS